MERGEGEKGEIYTLQFGWRVLPLLVQPHKLHNHRLFGVTLTTIPRGGGWRGRGEGRGGEGDTKSQNEVRRWGRKCEG